MADWFVHQVKSQWRYLANSASGGQIKCVALPIYKEILESVRKVWEIANDVKIKLEDSSQIVMKAGRSSSENLDENWQ